MEKFFIAMPARPQRADYFPQDCIDALEKIGSVAWNPYDRKLTEEELVELAGDATILLTHWMCPQVNSLFLDAAPQLKLIAHCAGTVAHIASEETYRRGIPCLSANPIMAKYVAEGVLGLILASLRGIKEEDLSLQRGKWGGKAHCVSLFDCTVGLVGLGAVGRNLLNLLTPFQPKVKIYDPYLAADGLAPWSFAEAADLDTVMGCDVVTIHASQTPETYHMIDAQAFSKMKDHAVFINTARASLVDTDAAVAAMSTGRIRGAIDVYDSEWCPQPQWAGMDNVILQSHVAGRPSGAGMTRAIVADIQRFLNGDPIELGVSYTQFSHMTQE